MCFDTSNYDWTASLSIESTGTSIKPTRCHECGKRIGMYEWRRHIYQQEYEECQRCEWEELGPDDEPCVTHDYGEVASYNRCEDCDKIIRAIEAFELREGCPAHESRPLLTELRDELYQSGEGGRYAAVAIETFPELGAVPWLVDLLTIEAM